MPEEEQGYNFCLRVAEGKIDLALHLYQDEPFSRVWETYAHQVLLSRYENPPRRR